MEDIRRRRYVPRRYRERRVFGRVRKLDSIYDTFAHVLHTWRKKKREIKICSNDEHRDQ